MTLYGFGASSTIHNLNEKVTPTTGDMFIIDDGANNWKVKFGNLKSTIGGTNGAPVNNIYVTILNAVTNYVTLQYVTNQYVTTNYTDYSYTTNLYVTTNIVNNQWVTNQYVSLSYITNLFVTTNYTDLSFITNLYVTTNYADYDYVTNLIVKNLRADIAYISNTFVTNITVTGSQTNAYLEPNMFVFTDANKKLVSTLDGSTLTNLPISAQVWTNDGSAIVLAPGNRTNVIIPKTLVLGKIPSGWNMDGPPYNSMFSFLDASTTGKGSQQLFFETATSESEEYYASLSVLIQTNMTLIVGGTRPENGFTLQAAAGDNALIIGGANELYLKPNAGDTDTPYTFNTSIGHTIGNLLNVLNTNNSVFSIDYSGLVSANGYQDSSLTPGTIVGVGAAGRLVSTNTPQVDVSVATKAFQVFTNQWLGATNSVNMTNQWQKYMAYTPCSITGLVNQSVGGKVVNNVLVTITNAASTNITLYYEGAIRTGDGARSWVITNACEGKLSLEYDPNGSTNAVFRMFY